MADNGITPDKLGAALTSTVLRFLRETLDHVAVAAGGMTDDLAVEYLVLLTWIVWENATDRFDVGVVQPALIDMNEEIYMELASHGIVDSPKTYRAFYINRHTGYSEAIQDESGDDEYANLRHVAQYFLACSKSMRGSVEYASVAQDVLLSGEVQNGEQLDIIVVHFAAFWESAEALMKQLSE